MNFVATSCKLQILSVILVQAGVTEMLFGSQSQSSPQGQICCL